MITNECMTYAVEVLGDCSLGFCNLGLFILKMLAKMLCVSDAQTELPLSGPIIQTLSRRRV